VVGRAEKSVGLRGIGDEIAAVLLPDILLLIYVSMDQFFHIRP
jgi:hypothetical protein